MDLIALVVALFATLVNERVASLVGPYAAIAVLACAGAIISISGNDKVMGTWASCKFFTGRVVVAVAVTVMLAQLLELAWPDLKPKYTVGPIALILGWIRDYNAVLQSLMDAANRLIQRKADGK